MAKVMFLDESGDHSLSVIDPQYPVFVLGGVIVDQDYAEGPLSKAVRDFKIDVFGRENLILHTSDIVRNRNGFEGLMENAFRKQFYEKLNRLMASLQFQVVACVVKKDAHLAKYGMAALDPYMLSLNILVERFCFEIGNKGKGVIIAEKRNPTLDHELDLAWLNLKIGGTSYVQAVDIERRIIGLQTRDKRDNIAGLQLADLVVSPIGRHVLGLRPHEDFKIVEAKFRKDFKGEYKGMGLVVLPKK